VRLGFLWPHPNQRPAQAIGPLGPARLQAEQRPALLIRAAKQLSLSAPVARNEPH
jgi:hypothetical protein